MARRPTPEDLATRPIINRAPDTMPDNLPQSRTVDRPAKIIPDTETPSQWSPYGTLFAHPYRGGHDPLSAGGHGIMHVAQAGMYDPSANPWPNNGQFGQPNGFWTGLIRLRPTTSAHPGKSMPAVPGPTMLFHAPPPLGMQSKPIPAVGV